MPATPQEPRAISTVREFIPGQGHQPTAAWAKTDRISGTILHSDKTAGVVSLQTLYLGQQSDTVSAIDTTVTQLLDPPGRLYFTPLNPTHCWAVIFYDWTASTGDELSGVYSWTLSLFVDGVQAQDAAGNDVSRTFSFNTGDATTQRTNIPLFAALTNISAEEHFFSMVAALTDPPGTGGSTGSSVTVTIQFLQVLGADTSTTTAVSGIFNPQGTSSSILHREPGREVPEPELIRPPSGGGFY